MSNNLQKLGEKYGYPKCCINRFELSKLFQRDEKFKDKLRNSLFNKTGFVPCERCIERPANVVIKFINKHRNPEITKFITTPKGTEKLEEYKKELFEVKEPAYKVFELPRLDTIDSHETINTFPIEGVEGRLYIDHSTGNNYIWVLNQYKPIIIVTDLHRR